MKQEQAMEYVKRLFFGLQRARSVTRENAERMEVDGNRISQELANKVLQDLLPWTHGVKGNALLRGLEIVVNRGSVTGMEFYNFMTIIHRLDPTIRITAGMLADTQFPEPQTNWIAELGI